MSEISKSLIVSFDALNLVKGIKSIGGPDKQVYYIESNLYAPDRRITPLILQPYILVEDPHNIIASGDKVGELSSAEWYFDEIKSENRITAKEENASIDTPFALGANNSLHIRKNVEKAIQLFFEAEYLDTRKNKNIHISLTYLLSTTQSSEVKPAPKLKLSKPQSWKYCPLDKATEATIEAEVFADNKGYKSAVEWCKVEGDKVTPLSNEPFVLGGQNTDKLKVNPHVMGDSLIRARNVSEEFYNKVYGINPEWDSKMKEVFDNRNLATNSICKLGNYNKWANAGDLIFNDNSVKVLFTKDYTFNQIGITTQFPIKSLKKGVKYYITFWAKGKNSSPLNYIYLLTPSDNTPNISIANSIGNKDKINPNTYTKFVVTYTPTSDEAGLRLLIGHAKVVLNDFIEIKDGVMVTEKPVNNYTPAPEDLNFRNLVTNGDFRDGDKGWILHGCKAKFTTREVVLTPEVKIGHVGIWCAVNIGLNYNDLVYMACLIKPQTNKLARFSAFNSEPAVEDFRKAKINEWNYSSAIVRTGSSSRNNLSFYHQSEGYLDNQSFELKNPFSINLTRTFGAGNEPTKEQLDAVFANMPYIPSPQDYTPDGIVKGSYQSDIKFTKYFPDINAEILFLTGDSIRPEHKTVKAQALFATNKEPINNPSEFFDIEWYLDPVEAGGEVKKIGTGEFMEIPITDLQLKGGRLVPIRLKYNIK